MDAGDLMNSYISRYWAHINSKDYALSFPSDHTILLKWGYYPRVYSDKTVVLHGWMGYS